MVPPVGVFGTVSAIVTSTSTNGTIVLDGGEAVATDSNTTFNVPGVEAATIDDVIERLTEDIEEAADESVERLKRLLENNGDQRLTALAKALARVPDQAKDALETALKAASRDLEQKYHAAGLRGPFVRVKGFVTAFDVVGGVGTTTIETVDGDEVTLSIVPATDIEEIIVVGDFVKAKYNLELQVKKIEIETGELTLRGTVAGFSTSTLELTDGTTFIIDEFTDIEGDLAVAVDVEVDAVPEDGSLTALEIKVKGKRWSRLSEQRCPV